MGAKIRGDEYDRGVRDWVAMAQEIRAEERRKAEAQRRAPKKPTKKTDRVFLCRFDPWTGRAVRE
jgi:hypothetical protein